MSVIKLDTSLRSEKSVSLQERFEKRIINQSKAIDAYLSLLQKQESGLFEKGKPLGSLLFLGPTGTGKTESVEVFTEEMTGSRDSMIKIDCGEYQHSHEVAKLIGSPPGYLGHRETGARITTPMLAGLRSEKFPFVPILFDEIEKASDALWNILLGILDKGILTLGTNEQVDMKGTVILMTSNVGSGEVASASGDRLGFASAVPNGNINRELEKVAIEAAKRKFPVEFLNRLDKMVMFNALTLEDITKIMKIEIDKLFKRTLIKIHISPAAEKEIAQQGFDQKYNARFLQRTVEKLVTVPLSTGLSTGQIKTLDSLIVDFKDGQFEYTVERFGR